ncbi:hypothetical protein ACHAW5_002357 [Stephanodiscus triporus]|uniref:Calmodulin n=1 Tax=Stephanodiscus triporus TaxID=2934178 RepID=A0ABD3PNA0_9STRA
MERRLNLFEEQFCFSHLEDDLHSTFTKESFIEGSQFTSLFQELDLYCETAAATEEDNPLVVVGDSGVGKSAALATWAARRVCNSPPTRNRLDDVEFVFYHHIGCSRLSTQVLHLLRRLVNSIIVHFQLKDAMNLADEKLPWILPRLLERASKKGRVVICLDGLHHICSNDKDFGLKWLPKTYPAGVKLIVSATTPNDETRSDHSHHATYSDHDTRISDHSKKFQAKVQQTWNEIQRRKWPTLSLECAHSTCVANFIDSYLLFNTSLEQILGMRSHVIEIVCTHPLSTNLMFVNFLVRGLCHAVGMGYNAKQFLVAWMPSRTTAELFEHILSLFETDAPRQSSVGGSNSNSLGSLLGNSLCLLFVARHGLHERELIELLDLVQKQSSWNSQTQGTVVPVKLNILKMMIENKQRLIDIFRSFDTDGNGRDEITLLMAEADNNGDGEIDYQEILAQFDHLARSYSHGKRRDSVFLREHPSNNAFSLTDEEKQNLISTLRCVGVSCFDRDGSVLTLPFENSALRAAIWKTYIKCESNESKYRTLLVDCLSKKEPSPRYCEELPWHLKKENKWVEMKKILVDLRTLDIMFNSIELNAELFNYLRILSAGAGGKVKFDIIAEYNQSMQQWVGHTNPSSKQLSMMSSFIADVMAWFDSGISDLTQSPPFLRERVGGEYLSKLGIELPSSKERTGTAGSKTGIAGLRTPGRNGSNEIHSEAQYFFNRWIWIQFPWIGLKNATITNEDNHSHPKANASDNTSVELVADTSVGMNLREKTMIRAKATELSSTLDMIESTKPQNKNSSERELRELKSIHNMLQVEVEARERQYKELERTHKARHISELKNQTRVACGEGVLRALQTRLGQMNDLIGRAESVDLVFNDILLALHSFAPSQMRQIELEQQIVLYRQQIADLTNEKGAISKETENADSRSSKLQAEVKSVVQERQSIKPLLESFRMRANEESEQKKNTRLGSFDPEAFSRRVRIECKIAKRREERNAKRKASFEVVNINEASTLHPMERIAQIAGTRDPDAIVGTLNEPEIEKLRLRHEQSEQHVKEQLAKLESLQIQTNQISLSDGNVELDSTVIDQHDSEDVLFSKQKRLDSMSHFIDSLFLAILSLSDKVQLIEEDYRYFLMAEDDHTKKYKDAKRLFEATKFLREEIPSEFVLSKKGPSNENEWQTSGHPNVRILNRAEKESQFAEDLNDVENEDGNIDEQVTDIGEDDLDSYVNKGIYTNGSKKKMALGYQKSWKH